MCWSKNNVSISARPLGKFQISLCSLCSGVRFFPSSNHPTPPRPTPVLLWWLVLPSAIVSVFLGRCNHSVGGWLMNNRNLFPTSLEAGSLRLGCHHGRVLCGPSSGLQAAEILRSRMAERCKGALWGPFYNSTNPIVRTPPSWRNHLPESPPSNSITLEVKISTYECRGDQTFHPLQEPLEGDWLDGLAANGPHSTRAGPKILHVVPWHLRSVLPASLSRTRVLLSTLSSLLLDCFHSSILFPSLSLIYFPDIGNFWQNLFLNKWVRSSGVCGEKEKAEIRKSIRTDKHTGQTYVYTRGDSKNPEFIYKKLCIYSYIFILQSPSKNSPFDAIHL